MRDKDKLTAAINAMDYTEVAKEYKLIEAAQVHVLVPYSSNIELFNLLAAKARSSGIDAGWLRLAAPLTVNTFDKAAASDSCERAKVRVGAKLQNADDWFILGDPGLYKADTGLRFNKGRNQIY